MSARYRFVFQRGERELLRRFNDARRVHVVDPVRKATAAALCRRGYGRVVAEDDGLLVVEPTPLGVNVDPFTVLKPGRRDGPSGPSAA